MDTSETVRVLMEWSPATSWQCDVDGHILFGDSAEELCDQIYDRLKETHGSRVAVFYDYTLAAQEQASTEDWNDLSSQGVTEERLPPKEDEDS